MQRPRIWGLWHMRQLTPKEFDLGWNVSSEKHERSLVLLLSIQYLPSSHRQAFLFCPAYCTFTLKEKDTQFPLTKLKKSTINPAAACFALLSSQVKGCVLPCLLPGRQAVSSSACSPSSLVVWLLLDMKQSGQAVPASQTVRWMSSEKWAAAQTSFW